MCQSIKRCLAGGGLIVHGMLLSGCGMIGESATGVVVAPGQFEYYNCEQLAEAERPLRVREQELSELMARASQGPGGEIVGAIAYRTELIQARGRLRQIREVSERKNCVSQSKWASDRALR